MSKRAPARPWLPLTGLCLLAGCASNEQTISTTPASDEEAAALIEQATLSGRPVLQSNGKRAQEVLCRRESVTNTRLRTRRVCLTAAQWQEREMATRDALNQADRPGLPPRGN